jgi:hypothetical protein
MKEEIFAGLKPRKDKTHRKTGRRSKVGNMYVGVWPKLRKVKKGECISDALKTIAK